MIKKIRFEVTADSYAEMAHLAFFNNDVQLEVDRSSKTITLKDGTVHSFTATASDEYGGSYGVMAMFGTDGPAHSSDCWCSSTAGGEHWLELEFTPALPNSFANKLIFCCGQNEGSYPGTFSLFFIDENGSKKQIGEPLYVNAFNGLFEWKTTIPCLLGKNGRYYFLKPTVSNK